MAYRYESATIVRVVMGLVLLGLAAVGLIGALAWQDKRIPDALTAIGVGSMTALATLLTTFTPSPIPGGRRAADAGAVPLADTQGPVTPPAPAATVGPTTPLARETNQHG